MEKKLICAYLNLIKTAMDENQSEKYLDWIWNIWIYYVFFISVVYIKYQANLFNLFLKETVIVKVIIGNFQLLIGIV